MSCGPHCGGIRIPTFAIKGESKETFFKHIEALIAEKPMLTMTMRRSRLDHHQKHQELLPMMLGGTEETTTGVIRLRAMHKDGASKCLSLRSMTRRPRICSTIDTATGQSTLDGIIRATGFCSRVRQSSSLDMAGVQRSRDAREGYGRGRHRHGS